MAGTQTFDVDVGGKTYEVDAPDANTAWAWANQTHQQAAKPVKSTPAVAPVSGATDAGVAQNAANKTIAGIPDALLNTPTNIWNLIKSVPAMAKGEPLPEQTATPDLANKAFRSMGFIKDEKNPGNARQRLIEAAVQGAVGTAISPASTGKQLATNAATGLLGGLAGEGTQQVTGNDALATTAALATPMAVNSTGNRGRAAVERTRTENSRNEVRNETLDAARAEGYVTPPSTVNPSFTNNRLESIAGKAALKQEASLRNQVVTDAIAARELGLPGDTAMTPGRLEAFRAQESAPYRQVAAISPQAATLWEQLRDVRRDKQLEYEHYDRQRVPQALRNAEALQVQETALERQIDQIASQSGQPQLVHELRQARMAMAKSFDIERALNLGDATVSAPAIGRAHDRGAPLTGGLETIGRFAHGPGRQVVTEGNRVSAPGVSGTEIYGSTALAAAGSAATGNAAGAIAGGFPLLRGPARSLLLSDFWQRNMANPERTASRTNRVLAEIPNQSPGQQAIQSLLLERALAERN